MRSNQAKHVRALFREALYLRIIGLLRVGLSYRKVAAAVGLSARQLRRIRKRAEFQEQLDKARLEFEGLDADTAREIEIARERWRRRTIVVEEGIWGRP